MTNLNLVAKSKELNDLACKECTKGWIQKHDKKTSPIDDVNNCYEEGLISLKLKDRLIKEIEEIYHSI
tara:strand:+ start:341 stop:544 length:204 start_codon:yes stop_codon:yes gene_type:complete